MPSYDLTRHLAETRAARAARRAADADVEECAGLRAAVARLEEERDAARAALAGLLADVEHFARENHENRHRDDARWTFETCDRGVCPGFRRALARAEAATGKGGN